MLLYKDTPNGKEYMKTHGFTTDKSQAHDFSEQEARQKMKEYIFLVAEKSEVQPSWPPEIMTYKERTRKQAEEIAKESGLPLDGDFEPCSYDVERERREMEKQERHDYIDRHREVRK